MSEVRSVSNEWFVYGLVTCIRENVKSTRVRLRFVVKTYFGLELEQKGDKVEYLGP
jgi:hypothetical protein